MQLNKFIWNNYQQSEEGQIAILSFRDSITTDGTTFDLLGQYLAGVSSDAEAIAAFSDILNDFCSSPNLSFPEETNFDDARALFDTIASDGFTLTFDDGEVEIYNPSQMDLLNYVTEISIWLYRIYPDFFKPYFFLNKFHLLTQIADNFSIKLPDVPSKRDKVNRFNYYFKLCEVFRNYQINNNLKAEEFCAFLYNFAPKYIFEINTTTITLPQPTQVWMIGGDKSGADFEFIDSPINDETSSWQGNEDTKLGDILVMYCLAPRSYIHSIWRATSDGIADPFFHYYGSINIGHRQKIELITLNELKADSHFSQNPLVRRNLQGVSGYPLTAYDYRRLQEMILAKGGHVDKLPQLYSHIFDLNKDLTNEREVEINLIEPLLEKLGYNSDDWVRQLPVRMGRGERNFPDYTFLIDKTKNYEKASMLIESKFWIKNTRELEETFKQVWSYGQRLNARKLVIADKDAIWVYEKIQDSFDRSKYIKKFWKELESPDNFVQLKRLIGIS